jgi:hypothetical protein
MFRGGKVPGYDPPISLALAEFQNGVEEQLGNGVMEYLYSIDIHVDKEELIKALQYDRGQYEKGYQDGCRDSQKRGQWIPIEYDGYADGFPVWDLWECSECREEHSGDEDTLTPYCPNCGAKMDGGNDNA